MPAEPADFEASLRMRPTWNQVLHLYRDHRKPGPHLMGSISLSDRGWISMGRSADASTGREDRMKSKSMRRTLSTLLLAGTFGLAAATAHAISVTESFANATAPGWTLSGSATLTGTGAPDPAGSGWLRLTPASGGQGYAIYSNAFATTESAVISFDFADYGGVSPSADGLTFFLFNAAGPFAGGNGGGGFGYVAMANGALAVGVADAFPSDFVNGVPASIAVRGPGPGTAFIAGTGGLSPTPETPARGLTPADPNFRRLTITLAPAGAGSTRVSVELQRGASVSTMLSNVLVSGLPANVRFGFSASTGLFNNIHEVRNFQLTTDLASASTAIPTLSEWGIVMLSATLLLGSLAMLSRRRRKSSA